MKSRPGVPSLLRALNDRAAMDLLLSSGPLTRVQIGEATGLSRVTASQLLQRLETSGFVRVVGAANSGQRGPNAEMYGVVPDLGYAVAVHVEPHRVSTRVCDITGAIRAQATIDPRDGDDPVAMVHSAIIDVLRRARIPKQKVASIVIGVPGLVDPRTGDVRYAFDLPDWHVGLRDSLRKDLKQEIVIENDVNLAGLAERSAGAAMDVDDFVLMWIGRGLGLAVFTGGSLVRGAGGGAGEIGYLPVPDMPLPRGVEHPRSAGFQAMVGAEAVCELARTFGIRTSRTTDAAGAVTDSFSHDKGEEFRDELARRTAIGLASVCAVLDPAMAVLSGDVSLAGGDDLTKRVSTRLHEMAPNKPLVVAGAVAEPVLTGALTTALDLARDRVLPS